MTVLSTTIPAPLRQPAQAQETKVNSHPNEEAKTTEDGQVTAPIDASAKVNGASEIENGGQHDSQPREDALEYAVTQLKEYLQTIDRNLEFSIDKESGRTLVKVIDADTDEVIRQIPSDDIIRMSRNLEDVSGLLVDARA